MKAMDSKPYEKERKKDIYRIFKKYDRTNNNALIPKTIPAKANTSSYIWAEIVSLIGGSDDESQCGFS
mgnify:CR=1 FL=1